MTYQIDGVEYEVIVEKKNNKNTYIRIKDDLKIYVTTSRWATKKEIEKILVENEDTLRKMVQRKKASLEKNSKFFYLGHSYDIIEVSIMDKVELDENRIYTPNQKTLEKWYNNEIKNIFWEHYQQQFNRFDESITMPSLKIRSMKTRWGVYNKKNHSITLNSHLIEYSLEKLDYVIVHELSHIIYFDHSKSFWQLVSKYCPDYKKIRKALKE